MRAFGCLTACCHELSQVDLRCKLPHGLPALASHHDMHSIPAPSPQLQRAPERGHAPAGAPHRRPPLHGVWGEAALRVGWNGMGSQEAVACCPVAA